MFGILELKLIAGLGAAIVGIFSYVPYVRDMLKGTTKPHPYTWIIWCITTGTAAFAVWLGGGRYGALPLFVWTVLTFLIFLLSFKHGTKNITKSDGVLLALAFLAIIVWWQLKNPLLAVLMVTGIDTLGYIPTMRKSFQEPWSESVLSWVLFTFTAVLSLLSLGHYSLLTVVYSAMSATLNSVVIALCLLRRRAIPKPVPV